MKYNLKWSTNNSKLKKTHTISFPLPAVKTCPGAGSCRAFCYAGKGCYVYPVVRAAREFNLAMTRRADFVALAVADLAGMLNTGRRVQAVRWHDSGDIYNQAYLNKLFAICRALPMVRFYAYTKSIHLDWSKKPDNFLRIASEGGRHDARIDRRQHNARIFPTAAALKRARYADGGGVDLPSLPDCPKRIGLVLH